MSDIPTWVVVCALVAIVLGFLYLAATGKLPWQRDEPDSNMIDPLDDYERPDPPAIPRRTRRKKGE